MGLLIVIAIAAINMNSSGGILKAFNSAVGIPEGAVEIINSDGAHHLMFVFIKGRNAITQEPVQGEFEVVRPLTATDMLVKNSQGTTEQEQLKTAKLPLTKLKHDAGVPLLQTSKK